MVPPYKDNSPEEDWKIEEASELWKDELQMLAVFRKNCWLSGADIEASAHEKVEWIQGFGKEEIETWKLEVLEKQIDWETRRVAATFESVTSAGRLGDLCLQYSASIHRCAEHRLCSRPR